MKSIAIAILIAGIVISDALQQRERTEKEKENSGKFMLVLFAGFVLSLLIT